MQKMSQNSLKMLKRTWTLVIGYITSYYTFDLRYKDEDHPSRKFLPDERISWILFGYWSLILAWTIMGTLFLNAVESKLNHKYEGDQEVSQTNVWILLEICFWFVIANWSVYEWTCIGQRFNGNPKRMFACGVAYLIIIYLVHLFFGQDDEEGGAGGGEEDQDVEDD